MKRLIDPIVVVATLLLFFLYVSTNDGGGSLSPYVLVGEIVREAKNSKQPSVSKNFVKQIGYIEFYGAYYLSEGKKLVLVIKKPEPTIWIFDDIKGGGNCYLAYGKGAIGKFRGWKELPCTNI